MERKLSESENSEEGDEREKWIKKKLGKNVEELPGDVTELQPDLISKKKDKIGKNIEFKNEMVHNLDG